MSRRSRHAAVVGIAAAGLLTSALVATAGETTRVSVTSAEAQANGSSGRAAISADGRFVAFQSGADDLVAADTNGTVDIFVRDRRDGITRRVSLSSSGVEAEDSNGTGSVRPDITANGRFVAFTSGAANLVAGDTGFLDDIFVRDRRNGSTSRVSLTSTEAQANDHSDNPAFSSDGRFVAFDSFATNLAPPDTNAKRDVFVRDRQAGTTERVSVSSTEAQANGFVGSNDPAISANGRFVAFKSDSTNLVSGDTNDVFDIFIRDRQLGTTERVSVSSAEAQANGDSVVAAISSDGRLVAFESFASNLVPGDTNGAEDVFVRDRQTGTTSRMSVSSTGEQGNQPLGSFLFGLDISGDGRFVGFTSEASNLVAGDTNRARDVFLRDRQTGTTSRMSVKSTNAPISPFSQASGPATNANGRFVAFSSEATLVPDDTNDAADVFLRDRRPGATATTTTK